MSDAQPDPTATALPTDPADERRIAFERLRERTDELELIVSGLFAFALLALPSWLFDGWASMEVHAEGFLWFAALVGYMMSSGLCYTLGIAFLVHLTIRAYWVGLIGLKSSFPKGIRWDSIATLGPFSRDYYRRSLPDLMAAIDRADRVASILFSMAVLIALLLLWSGVVLLVLAGLGSLIGLAFGEVEKMAFATFAICYGAFMAVAFGLAVIDAGLVRRRPALQQSLFLRRLVERGLRLYGLVLPQRLILPVQLTLQSNLSARMFWLSISLVSLLSPLVGVLHLVGSQQLSVFGGYEILNDDAIEHGLVSAHYENLRDEHDRLLRYPTLPADRIAEAHLRLFLPHRPERDNVLLRKRCPELANGDKGAEAAAARTACLAGLWTISLDGAAVPLDDFLPTERRDLGMRGLIGYLPMAGLVPGRHDLLLVWNTEGGDSGRQRRREYRIPFWFSPSYEMAAPPHAVAR